MLFKFRHAPSDVKYYLFKIYCMSLYGYQLWNLESISINRFYVAWRKCCRHLLNVPYRAHNDLLHLICNDSDIDNQLHRRQLAFIVKCLKSSNSVVKLCASLSIGGSTSDVSCSLNYICYKYKLNKYHLWDFRTHCIKYDSHSNSLIAGIIRDFIKIKENISTSVTDKRNNSFIIDYLCTN